MDRERLNKIAKRIIDVRSAVLIQYPFFGRILMRLPVLFSEDGTAATDMRRIIFSVNFAEQLYDDQIAFVLLHEVMHCVLKHCIRGRDKLPTAYNIACDIVVNSLLLECMGLEEIEIAGENVMHLTPDNKEGRLFTAEEVYDMILGKSLDELSKWMEKNIIDSHDKWKDISKDSLLDELWSFYAKEAGVKANGHIPLGLKRYIEEKKTVAKIDWKQVLHDFIQFTKCDFLFVPPDRRFQGDFIMPSFIENSEGCCVERIWFCVDTSGSISNDALTETIGEIRNAVEQIENVSGYISFFDADITEPHPFDSIDTLEKAEVIGGGGTDFCQIFSKVPEFFTEELPKCVIIMTDGYAGFPNESDTYNIPVLWIIVGSDVEAPFGTCIHIDI